MLPLDLRAQKKASVPAVGYLYPAGGRQGTEFIVTVGGEGLHYVTDVHVSGEGVHATVEHHIRGIKSLFAKKKGIVRQELRSRAGRSQPPNRRGKGKASRGKKRTDDSATTEAEAESEAGRRRNKGDALGPNGVPYHPLLHDMENMSTRELQHADHVLFRERRKRQENRQIAQLSVIKLTIEPDAAPGTREVRLIAPTGMSNALNFEVGTLPEFSELEPNDPENVPQSPNDPPLQLPVVINGQILPGDVDHFRFKAEEGQQLVLTCHARRLIPYIADAVPGWFQATLTLYDAEGEELAFADDLHFDPDPVLLFKVPSSGVYAVKVQDAIFRGRQDFVYRLSVSERPFVTSIFPLGAKEGSSAVATAQGWNLPGSTVTLNTRKGGSHVRRAHDVRYAVGHLDEVTEHEPNNSVATAQSVRFPITINGRIAEAGDLDYFRFDGKAGAVIVAEVMGRRLNSPIDSLLRLLDGNGKVLQWNDDYSEKAGHLHKGQGLLTHHADSYLRTRLPGDGLYYLQISDIQNQGGQAHGYRLRISPPQQAFSLRMTPSRLDIVSGATVPVTLYATREDGFAGAIDVAVKDAPEGLTLSGATIPPGCSEVRMTLTASGGHFDGATPIQLEGRAVVDGRVLTRPVAPADDVMQAFLYRHLRPSGEMLISEAAARRRMLSPAFQLASEQPVQLPVGGAATVLVKCPRLAMLNNLKLQLQDPPEGIRLGEVRVSDRSLEIQLTADAELASPGLRDNLIIEASHEVSLSENRKKNAKRPAKRADREGRASAGVIPAIAIQVVQR